MEHQNSVNPLVTGGFPSQKTSSVASVSMSWRHHVVFAGHQPEWWSEAASQFGSSCLPEPWYIPARWPALGRGRTRRETPLREGHRTGRNSKVKSQCNISVVLILLYVMKFIYRKTPIWSLIPELHQLYSTICIHTKHSWLYHDIQSGMFCIYTPDTLYRVLHSPVGAAIAWAILQRIPEESAWRGESCNRKPSSGGLINSNLKRWSKRDFMMGNVGIL